MSDIRLTFDRPGAQPLHLTIEKLDSRPMRSRYALFDVLFRSSGSGKINDRPFTIVTNEIENGRRSVWDISALPVDIATRYFTMPPLGWLTEGTMDVQVTDTWRQDEKTEIDMNWRIVLNDVRAQIPGNLAPLVRRPLQSAANYINAHNGPLEIGFDLTMNEDQFEGAASLGAAGLWRAVSKDIIAKIARRQGIKPGEASERLKRGVRRFKDFLNRKRKTDASPQ